ncbi:MAG: sugar phosphate nucleotidyltransferase [Steroidobacteraceae bacterium]
MKTRQRTWAIVLAAGDGTRLSTLTTDAQGVAVPKQYCSLDGEGSLLQDALMRTRALVPRSRSCVIVSAQHRRYWQSALWAVPQSNVIVQPRNCGTAIGILLAVLQILERDPFARIVFVPADHHVRDEAALARGLREMATLLTRHPQELLLLGIEPEEPDPELGYIVPGAPEDRGGRRVLRFAEKPPRDQARALIEAGALWNSFIFAAHGPTLLGLLRERLPAATDAMATAIARDARLGGAGGALASLYETLESVDFSRTVLQGAESRLRVVSSPACGWTDLGTPKRVGETLRRLPLLPVRGARRPAFVVPGFVNLAAQHRAAAAGRMRCRTMSLANDCTRAAPARHGAMDSGRAGAGATFLVRRCARSRPACRAAGRGRG